MSEADLVTAVDEAFRSTSRGLRSWPDPHPDRSPNDDEYSRLTDPQRWRIVGARAEAWMVALTETGLAHVHRGEVIDWVVPPGPVVTSADRVVPRSAGAIPLVVAHSGLGNVDDAGVVLGAGDQAIEIGRFPDCGCDACDSGSQAELDRLDGHVIGIVTGRFRHLRRRGEVVMTIGDGGWSASGRRRPPRAARVLADPRGWEELTGAGWL